MTGIDPLGAIELGERFSLRLVLLIRGVHIENDRDLVVPFKADHLLEVRLRRPTRDEMDRGNDLEPALNLGDTMCVVSGDWGLSDASRSALATLAAEGGKEMTQQVVIFGVLPSESGGRAWDALPGSLQDLLTSALIEMGSAAKRVFRILRWHWHLPGSHDPHRLWSLSWSPDQTRWQDLPWKVPPIVASVVPTIRSSEARERELSDAVERGEDEPIAHELLREAQAQVDENPRSALIVGIAAAEIRVKEFVQQKLPLPRWLVTEVQAPPLLSMLTEFLPSLVGEPATSRGLWFSPGKHKQTRSTTTPY